MQTNKPSKGAIATMFFDALGEQVLGVLLCFVHKVAWGHISRFFCFWHPMCPNKGSHSLSVHMLKFVCEFCKWTFSQTNHDSPLTFVILLLRFILNLKKNKKIKINCRKSHMHKKWEWQKAVKKKIRKAQVSSSLSMTDTSQAVLIQPKSHRLCLHGDSLWL